MPASDTLSSYNCLKSLNGAQCYARCMFRLEKQQQRVRHLKSTPRFPTGRLTQQGAGEHASMAFCCQSTGQAKVRQGKRLTCSGTPSSRLQFEGANGVQGQCTAQVMPKNKTQRLESKRKGKEVSKAVFQRAFQIMINTEKCLSMQGEPGAHAVSQIYAFVSSAFLIQTFSSSRLNNLKSHPRGPTHHKAVYSPNTLIAGDGWTCQRDLTPPAPSTQLRRGRRPGYQLHSSSIMSRTLIAAVVRTCPQLLHEVQTQLGFPA